MKNGRQLRVAVIGAGNMGRNHLRTYRALDGISLVALADVNPAADALAEEYGIPAYRDYEDMLTKEKPDAVSVVVPTTLHHQIAINAMRRGIHCLVEKPIAGSPEEGNELIKAAKKYNVIFTVGHIERFNPMVQKLKRLIDSQELGNITSIVVKRVGGFPAVEPKTNVILDLAVHDIDILSYLLGSQPNTIVGHGSQTLHSSHVDSAELFLDYGRASGFIQVNWITPVKIRTIAVTGSDGYVEGNYITQDLVYYKHSMSKKREEEENFANFVQRLGEPERIVMSDELEEPLRNELSAFTRAIVTGDSSELVDPVHARDALNLALIALEKERVL